MNYHYYDSDRFSPKSDPATSYEYVKDLRYFSLDKNKFREKYPVSKSILKNAFISDNKVIYQIQWHNSLTKVYQISFGCVNESIDDFLGWLSEEINNGN